MSASVSVKPSGSGSPRAIRKKGIFHNFKNDIHLYVLLLIPTILIFIFYYLPDFGIVMAFQDFNIGQGFFHSPFIGLANFKAVFTSYFFLRCLKNTVLLGVYSMVFSFIGPIIFALLLNEVKNHVYKRTLQTISYLPHFVSTVIMVGMVFTLFAPSTGIFTILLKNLTGNNIQVLGSSRWFRTLFVGMQVYTSYGWDSIIFLAALSSVDPALYEAAKIDGANRWQQMKSITLPSILPPIVIILIMKMGSIIDVGFESVFLLQTPPIYDVADTISTYVYRRGIIGENGSAPEYGFSAAMGLFVSGVGFLFVLLTNYLSKKVNDISLF